MNTTDAPVEKLKRMIMNTTDAPVEKLNLIDTLQKLCVAYNFEEEIEDALQKIYNDCDIHHYNDLHNVFEKFKDVDRKFKSSLINDVQGMLNLGEAAHFAIHGEDILDEALAFTATQLKSVASRVSTHVAEEINHTLKFSIRKSVPRLEARFFLSTNARDDSHNKTLLKFAKLDYNILQLRHRKQLSDILK
ncbi:(E)-beta-farnesene synthase-like [Pistacia vera]|uniref:(E)-beta-farnesene synthase-like n=1 Tax=Pistacia vera TaxID=55513 RepID=UPI001262C70C|nr:(E)-beta-farnesene synthase-like [Pistacia vera]